MSLTRAGWIALVVVASCDDGVGKRCEEPRPLLFHSGAATGFVQCADGPIARVSQEPVPPPEAPPACAGDEPDLFCDSDADCTNGPNGVCGSFDATYGDRPLPRPRCICVYHCTTDADCNEHEACIPAELTGSEGNARCEPATCRTGDDCTSGECGVVLDSNLEQEHDRSLACGHGEAIDIVAPGA